MRADARRNRRRLLDGAVELILELGGEPSRDAIAQRAEVGIGTLYRHFPDQQALLRAVVLDVLDRTVHLGETALAESKDGREALRRYLHGAIDTGLGVVNVIYPMLDGTDWPEQRSAAAEALERLTEAARRDGAIGREVGAGDIAIASIRFCRPLALGLDPAEERAIAHRHLDTYLDGLAVDAA
ncbi:TetR/AcrR family transcriptional regulator [Egicoccus halophilus]|uniref:TetR family transcriptional regulator n=1 Tax=Egicoccus halophilus TaxID=1670830 RepID=A0A8J3ETK5_9ACTN|nr:TetR/AcrR family transcriptional regulator [Egicoccus halophilus]GGI09828.1 TetR family transcriptional regulator [Egicoccus halophilus]